MHSRNWTEPDRGDSFAAHRAVLYRELYTFLTAADHGAVRPPLASATDLPRPLARSVVHFYSLLRRYTVSSLDHALADQIALAVAGWFASIWGDLRSSAPMENLLASRPGAESPSPDHLEEQLDRAAQLWPEQAEQWKRLRHLLIQANTTGSQLHRRALCRSYVNARYTAVRRQRDLRRERAIRLVASPLADHLNELVPALQERQKNVRALFGTGGLWRILDTAQYEIDWETLAQQRDFLEQAPGLPQLCRTIVGGADPSGFSEVELEHTVPITRTTMEDQGLGEVEGLVREGGTDGSLAGLIQPEIGLLAFPETEDLFVRKLSEGTLLQLSHRRTQPVTVRTEQTIVERVRRRRARGPVVVCIDTSGSMRGIPERVARAAILGILREAILAQRSVAVLLYTDHLEEVELPVQEDPAAEQTFSEPAVVETSEILSGTSPPAVPEYLLERLSALFNVSLVEGTDFTPAMERALSILEQKDAGTTSDVVVVSDVRFPRVPPRHLNRMYGLQAREIARFHCLTINEEQLLDPLNVFDYRWFFNTGPRPSFEVEEKAVPIGLDILAFRGF